MSSPDSLNKVNSSLAEKWDTLQPREKVMLVGLIFALSCMALYVVFSYMHNNIEKQIAETENYRAALNYIADNQAIYLQNTAEKEAMKQRLLKADSKIASKLTSMASSLGFDVTVTPKDARKTSDDSGAEEQEIDITVKNVDYYKFLEYLVQIHKLETPIFMRHINMQRSNTNNNETKMTGTITLISYRLKKDE